MYINLKKKLIKNFATFSVIMDDDDDDEDNQWLQQSADDISK